MTSVLEVLLLLNYCKVVGADVGGWSTSSREVAILGESG